MRVLTGPITKTCLALSKMNFVAINLANDIVAGKRSVEEARAAYGRLYRAYKQGEHPPYTQQFQFEVPKGKTGDPGCGYLVKWVSTTF